jgi:ABC-type polysaccharide/polyol phosphate transport system ATPase subunit
VAIIEVDNISKSYPARQGAKALLGRGGIASWFRPSARNRFEALRNISLQVGAGESLGIIGRNGSGKSTLLKILAGVTLPTTGRVCVRGRVASLLELGAGFHPMLTGRENVYLNAGLLGMRHREVDQVFDRIVDFSGIAPFIDQPVDTYSSGMYVRIAFAVAVHVNPDIFLVDEVLSVGDEEFQRKCRRKIGELKEQGKTIVFVSHDLGSVSALCDRVVLLSGGEMIARPTPQQTIEYYLRQVGQAGGVHTMRADDKEVMFNHGRISIFHRDTEITAGGGFRLQLRSRGTYHDSHDAEWRVGDSNTGHAEAVAELPRLPVQLRYRLELKDHVLRWRIGMRCLAPAYVDEFLVQLFFPLSYAAWMYDEETGTFPDIRPEDVSFTVIAPPEPGSTTAAVMQTAGAPVLPAPLVELKPTSPGWTLQVHNSDYAMGARVLTIYREIAAVQLPLAEGDHELLDVEIRLAENAASIEQVRARAQQARSVSDGPFTARMRHGAIELFWKGLPVSHSVHLHTQLCIGHLWHMSHALRWSRPVREENHIIAWGESPRFPLRQKWDMSLYEGVLVLEVWLEALEPLTIEEFNVSLGLDAAYSQWKTADEQGAFPPFDAAKEHWYHLNRQYAVGHSISTRGEGLPAVKLELPEQTHAFRPTAVNTGYSQHTRVVQALHVPEMSTGTTFDVGEHHLLTAKVHLSAERIEAKHKDTKAQRHEEEGKNSEF